jgi:hypothetical protein
VRIAVGTDLQWPAWARAQLVAAIGVAATADSDRPVAVELYERWFCRSTVALTPRPLVGEYRRAHAGNAVSIEDGLPVLERQDRIGRDGWWRTWNTSWRPRRADGRRAHRRTARRAVPAVLPDLGGSARARRLPGPARATGGCRAA